MSRRGRALVVLILLSLALWAGIAAVIHHLTR